MVVDKWGGKVERKGEKWDEERGTERKSRGKEDRQTWRGFCIIAVKNALEGYTHHICSQGKWLLLGPKAPEIIGFCFIRLLTITIAILTASISQFSPKPSSQSRRRHRHHHANQWHQHCIFHHPFPCTLTKLNTLCIPSGTDSHYCHPAMYACMYGWMVVMGKRGHEEDEYIGDGWN